MQRYVAGPAYGQDFYKISVDTGGTNARTPDEARSNLKALGVIDINQPLGPLGLDALGYSSIKQFDDNIPLGRNTVSGPTQIYINQVHDYTITDFDSITTYTVQPVGSGTVTRQGNTITYSPGSVPGEKGFVVNARRYLVSVQLPSVSRPEIITPVMNSWDVNRTLDVSSNSFAVAGSSDTHQSTDWQIADDPGFQNIVAESLADVNNKTTWQPSGLIKNRNHYLRVRYKGTTLGYGPWSAIIVLKTKQELIPSVEQLISYPSDRTANARYGISTDISSEGNRIVIGASGINAVYVIRRDPSGWAQEQKIAGPASSSFGSSVGINGDGSRIIIGASLQDATSRDSGAIHFWHRSGLTWSLKITLSASNQTTNALAGASVAINNEGSWAIAGTPGRPSDRGGAVVFQYSSATNTWVQHALLTAADNQSNLGKSVSIDGAGLYAVLGGPSTGVGRVRIWKRTGSAWAQITQPVSPRNVSGEQFGSAVKLSNDGKTLVVSARNGTENSKAGAGRVYVYELSNDQFLIKNTFTAAGTATPGGTLLGPSVSAFFGESIDISTDGDKILIGEPGEDSILANSGGVHVFIRNTSGAWFDSHTRSLLKAGVPVASQGFGSTVALTSFGDRAAVAASQDSTNGFTQSGSVRIFN